LASRHLTIPQDHRFNHSPTPNINYVRDYGVDSIRYITSRVVEEGEELCGFYGPKLWFEESDNIKDGCSPLEDSEDLEGDPFLEMMMDFDSGADVEDRGKVIPEEELPFEALDINNLVQEEDLDSVRTSR
jgi:tRNA-specific adenosine deaminase 3